MNIYDKFPMKFVKYATSKGLQLTLHEDSIDLNTGMKSPLTLYYGDGNYFVIGRYDYVKIIKTFDDLHGAIRDCKHGRDFMNGNIEDIYHNGFGDIDFDPFE